VVAQALSYAAFLHGTDAERLEREILGRHLRERGHGSLLDALKAMCKRASTRTPSGMGSRDSLNRGAFRIVVVLDEAPTELIRLVGYLEAIGGDHLTVDLVTVAAYEVNGTQVLIPQSVEPERLPEDRARVRPGA